MFKLFKSLFNSSTAGDGSISSIPVGQSSLTEKNYKGVADKKHWHKIQYAFSSGNTHYYCWSQDIIISYERMHSALDIYEELQYGINPMFLELHIKAIDEICSDEKKKYAKKVLDIAVLNSRMKERLELSTSIQLQIKLATIKYFDEYEDPFGYNHEYANRKISKWMENADVPTFFLNLPENQLITSGPELHKNLTDFLMGESTMAIKHLEHLITEIDCTHLDSDTKKSLDLQKEQLSLLKNWAGLGVTSSI